MSSLASRQSLTGLSRQYNLKPRDNKRRKTPLSESAPTILNALKQIEKENVLTRPETRQVLVFTCTYILIATLASLARGNWEFLIYIVVMIVMASGIAYLHFRVYLSKGILWCLSVWGLLHMMGGLLPVPDAWPIAGTHHVLYSLWLIPDLLKYDQIVHAYGFGVATWVSWVGLRSVLGERSRPTFGLLTLCVAAGTGFGAFNEVVEFVATLILEDTNVGDYTNTGWDLVANFIGAVAAATLIRVTSGQGDTDYS
jgi:hypothetical protein